EVEELSEQSLVNRSVEAYLGAGRGGRTPTRLPSADFESAASASSAIPALFEFTPKRRAPNTYCTLPSGLSLTSSVAQAIAFCAAKSRLSDAIHSQNPSATTPSFRTVTST